MFSRAPVGCVNLVFGTCARTEMPFRFHPEDCVPHTPANKRRKANKKPKVAFCAKSAPRLDVICTYIRCVRTAVGRTRRIPARPLFPLTLDAGSPAVQIVSSAVAVFFDTTKRDVSRQIHVRMPFSSVHPPLHEFMYLTGIENCTLSNLFLRLSAKKAASHDPYPTVAAGGCICAADPSNSRRR